MSDMLRRFGGYLFWAGAAALAGIFLIVMINGTWPAFLEPVQTLFADISKWVGGWAIVVEGWLFLGPGLLLVWAGNALEGKRTRS